MQNVLDVRMRQREQSESTLTLTLTLPPQATAREFPMSLKRVPRGTGSCFPALAPVPVKKVSSRGIKFVDMSHRQRVATFMLPNEHKAKLASAFQHRLVSHSLTYLCVVHVTEVV